MEYKQYSQKILIRMCNICTILAVLFFVSACDTEEINPYQDDTAKVEEPIELTRSITLLASMPKDEISTRIALTEDEKNIILTWEEGDQLDLAFIQGETKVKQQVTIRNISPDGKTAGFDIELPAAINEGTFDLYGVYGGGGISDEDPSVAHLPSNAGSASSLTALQAMPKEEKTLLESPTLSRE